MTISEVIPDVVDPAALPFHDPTSPRRAALVERCRGDLRQHGMFDIVGLMRPAAIDESLAGLRSLIDDHSFVHRRRHNIYFTPNLDGLAADHPALREGETAHRTVCADQIGESPVTTLYRWEPLRQFLADVLAVSRLHLMADELAAVNVMSYRDDEALNWHFDRSEFTTTLLLQRPDDGGVFEFRRDLRTDDDPRYGDVAAVLDGTDPMIEQRDPAPGTLSVFAGRNTAHRVTPTRGQRDRVIAVFSYSERPGVCLTDAERIGFYGRA